MAYDISRNVKFTANATNYELLTDINVKSALKSRLGLTSDVDYDFRLQQGINNLGFVVFGNFRISVNGESYSFNEPILGVCTSNGSNITKGIKSIRVELPGGVASVIGTFYFTLEA